MPKSVRTVLVHYIRLMNLVTLSHVSNKYIGYVESIWLDVYEMSIYKHIISQSFIKDH